MVYSFFLLLFTGCLDAQTEVIASLPEASGICYSTSRDSLFVANDEGRIYEITTNGEIKHKKRVGDYDLEGVACDDKNSQLLLAVEGSDNILVVKQKSLKVLKEFNVDRKYKKHTLLKKDKKRGLEGITYDDDFIYLSNQSNRRYPREDASVVVKIDSKLKKENKIKAFIDHGFTDIAGLSMHKGYLYMVSDSEDLLIKYDTKHKKVIKKSKLPKFAQEGVAFDNSGNIYFADDNGRVLKYKESKFE
jgi:uncharacterized protein YjiK